MRKTMIIFAGFFRCRRASALIEMAFVFPILLLLLIGMVEMSRMVLMYQKLDRVAMTVADLITQGDKVCTKDIDTFHAVAADMMQPFALPTNTIMVSSLVNPSGQTFPPYCTQSNRECISWQYTPAKPPQVIPPVSRLGRPGDRPVRPGNMISIPPGQNYIVVELFYNYTTMFNFTQSFIRHVGNQKVYRVAVYKPRLGSMALLTNPCGN